MNEKSAIPASEAFRQPKGKILRDELVLGLPEWVGFSEFTQLPDGSGVFDAGERECAPAYVSRGPSVKYSLLCEPLSSPGSNAFSGQAILDLPPGMWSVRTVDSSDGKTIAVETARGSPVVCGLYSPGGAITLFFSRLSD